MNRQFLSVLKLIIAGAWRRRYLLSLPILVMLPLSLVWAVFGPRTYVAKSLMLLQEGGPTNPLAKDGGQPMSRIQERIAGLQALMKSDRVLGNVYRDVMGDQAGGPREFAAWMRDFIPLLSLELIGTDFLEFQLKGPNPKGMGKQLEAVSSRFLEALLPEQNALFASQVLLEKRREEMAAAERAMILFKQRAAERMPPGGFSGPQTKLAETREHLQTRERQLQRIDAEITQVRAKAAGAAATAARVEQEIAQVRAELAGLESRGVDAKQEVQRIQARLVDLVQIQDLESRRADLASEMRELARQAEAQQRAVRQMQPLAEQLTLHEREASEAREAYEDYARRYQRAATTKAGGILNAPERIKLIDAPRDPNIPATSALRIAIIGLLASILLGLGLSIGAELLDPRLRTPEDLAEATGLPVVAHLA